MGAKAYGLISMDDKALKRLQKEQMAKKEVEHKEKLYLSTGVDVLDLIVGGGETAGWGMGYMVGNVVRDWGDSSSSKSFKACQMIAANYYKYKDKFKWCYQDIERGNNINTEKLYGFDIMAGSWKGPREVKTVQDWFYDVTTFMESMKADEVGVYILDSLDALSDEATEDRKEERLKALEKGKTLEKGSYDMDDKKFLSREMFRGIQAECEKHHVLLYVISQAREKVGATAFESKLRVNGGGALKFAESVRIQSKAGAKDIKDKVPISVQVNIIAEKMRHDKPFRSCQIPVVFDYGLDNIGASVDYIYGLRNDYGELLARANAIAWGGGAEVSEDSIEDFLVDNNAFETCREALKKKMTNIKNIIKWIQADEILAEKYGEKFGSTMTRDELIAYIETNGLQVELKQRVIAKWDAFEKSIASNRTRQFSSI